VPSLNIHTDRTAENPSVAGGATTAGNDPVPWIVWEENDGAAADADVSRQIFVAKGLKQPGAGTACTGFKPSAANNLNGFCWQQVGLDRLASGQPTPPDDTIDPTLNIDPTRAGVEPDIAFTGKNDTVVWVVWYEENDTKLTGLRSNQMVFAAKAVANATADGGFQWVAVGNGTAGQSNVLDVSGANHFGPCAESQANEDACSLNKIAGREALNPRVAAGTMTAGQPTVPWVAWEEEFGGGRHVIYVSRLVGGDHFELFNGGLAVSNANNDASRPDITFAGNVPYISWQEQVGTSLLTIVGHFEGGAAAPTFVLDTPDGVAASRVHRRRQPAAHADLVHVHGEPDQCGRLRLPGGAVGTPVLPLHGLRARLEEALRPGVRAERRRDARRDRPDLVERNTPRRRQPGRLERPRPLRLRCDGRIRLEQHDGDARRQRRPDDVRRSCKRPPHWFDAPLPRRRRLRLRDRRRVRRDGHPRQPATGGIDRPPRGGAQPP